MGPPDDSHIHENLRMVARLLPEHAAEIDGLLAQWFARTVRIAVLGEAKRGKSSLINALLGCDVLPTGVLPVTSIETEVRRGPLDSATVCFASGHSEAVPLSAVVDYVSEDRNSGNRLGVQSVVVTVAVSSTPESLVFIDTPGTGSLQERHDVVAEMASGRMDIAVFVVAADAPLSAREHELLVRATELSVALLIVVAKSDLLTVDELATVVAYTEQQAARATGGPVPVMTVSTRAGDGRDVDAVRQAVVTVGRDRADETLRRSLAGRAGRLVAAELDNVAIADSLAAMDGQQARERAALFTAALDTTRRDVASLAEVIAAGVRRTNRELDEQRNERVRGLARSLRERVDPLVERWVQGLDDQDAGMTALTREATVAAEAWRQQAAATVVASLEDIAHRVGRMAEASLAELRDVARDALGVTLTAEPVPFELPADPRFFYIEGTSVDAAAAVANLVRARLPRGLRRSVARARLTDAAGALADRQLGRARGDLRLRTADAEWLLISQATAIVDGLLDRLRRAVDLAGELAQERSAETDRQRSDLRQRRAALQGLQDQLIAAASASSAPLESEVARR